MYKEETLLDTIKTVFYAILIAIFIRSFFFEPFRIPSASMYPSLYIGDYLFVSKYTYGYSRHSLPLSLPLISGRVWADEPVQGDVVVFKYPQDNRTDFIKRVVGMPGDKIQMKEGVLYINDKLVERKQVEDFVSRDEGGNAIRYNQYVETLPNGVEHNILEVSDDEPLDNTIAVVVPEGHYFMMGDNRDKSDDSRMSAGFVPFENLVGKARFLFYSHNNHGAWYMPWTWPKKIRWDRIFDKVK